MQRVSLAYTNIPVNFFLINNETNEASKVMKVWEGFKEHNNQLGPVQTLKHAASSSTTSRAFIVTPLVFKCTRCSKAGPSRKRIHSSPLVAPLYMFECFCPHSLPFVWNFETSFYGCLHFV